MGLLGSLVHHWTDTVPDDRDTMTRRLESYAPPWMVGVVGICSDNVLKTT